MDNLAGAINNLISLSAFNKGEAGKIFSDIKQNNQTKIVLRRNEPECIIISPKSYTEMVQELEDLRDYKLAVERLMKNSKNYSFEEVMQKLNIDQTELDDMEDIEFE